MEDEDEESLKAVQNGKYVGDWHAAVVDEEIAKQPCQTQQNFQSESTLHPRPAAR